VPAGIDFPVTRLGDCVANDAPVDDPVAADAQILGHGVGDHFLIAELDKLKRRTCRNLEPAHRHACTGHRRDDKSSTIRDVHVFQRNVSVQKERRTS